MHLRSLGIMNFSVIVVLFCFVLIFVGVDPSQNRVFGNLFQHNKIKTKGNRLKEHS